jgi:GNAT superfamily N-acetyltransferase
VVRIEVRPTCELLEWDSEHFGFPIARVVGSTLTSASAEAIDDWCLDQGIRCLYFMADAGDAYSARIAAGHGHRVVDVRIIGRRSLADVAQLPPAPEYLEIREATDGDLDYLRMLSARSHRKSRFYFDGRFPNDRCDALYTAWVERGFHDPGRTVRVPLVDGEPAGYYVLGPLGPEREGRGELIAVDERHRRKGIGLALTVSTLRLVATRGALTSRSVTSARNIGEIRRIARLGYLADEVQVWHHKWYD